MGFIERLRQQREVEVQERSRRDSELATVKQVEDTLRRQKEAQEREFHQRRRLQAEAFSQESEVGLLVVKLGRFLIEGGRADIILQGTSALAGFPRPYFIRGDSVRLGYTIAPLYYDGGVRGITYPSVKPADQDSVFDIAMWDFKKVAESQECRDGTFDGYFSEGEQKFLAVETMPDGNIKFYTNPFIMTTSIKEWRGTNKKNDIVDKALEAAFNYHRSHRFRYRYVRNERD